MAGERSDFITLPDGRQSWVYQWHPSGKIRAVVLIAHGMAEHAGRYARLAAALNAGGYAVYAPDLPGHGRTARRTGSLGHVADTGSWAVLLSALHGVRAHIEQQHPDVPLFLFGHSMGSFIAQHHLVEHGAGLSGAVLSATSATLGPLRALGVAINQAQIKLFGPAHRSALTEALSFGAFNKAFKPNRTRSDWLSRDAAEVDAYIADPDCGFRGSAALWLGLLEAGAALRTPSRLARIPAALPVLLVSGSEDPVCDGGRGTHRLAVLYRARGLGDVTTLIYEGARHELLNETCREVVTHDLLNWLNERLPAE